MPNIAITVTSHDICDTFIVNTKNFNDEMRSLYANARKSPIKTVFIEGYPNFQVGVPGGIPKESKPCMIDDEFTIDCNI